MASEENEEKLLRSVALRNAKSILAARHRAEKELIQAKSALELRTEELAHSLAMMRATLESTTDGVLVTDGGGKITGFNGKFVEMWRIPSKTMDSRDHRRMLEACGRQFKDPKQFRLRVEEIDASSLPESYDLLELMDGRVVERFSKIQRVAERNVGRVWSFRDITQRRRAEAALQKQSEWLRVTLFSIGDAVITTDTEARVTSLNLVAESLTGWTQQEARGRPLNSVFRIINEQTRQPVENPATRALKEGVIVGLANHSVLIRKDGTERPIDDSVAPIKDEQGHVAGCVLIFRDVTEKRRAEEALQQSEERYRSLTQAITSVVWTVDEAGRFVTPQPSWSEYTGQTWEELRDFGWVNALHADDRERVWKLWEAARAARTLYKLEGRLWHAASGSYRHFEARGVPILNPDGSVREWVGKCLDVEDRKRAEQALRESEERFRNMADNAPVMVWVAEPDATCTYLSKSWYDYTGQTPETGLGFGRMDAVHPDDQAYAHDTFAAANAKRKAFRLEYRLRRKDGEYRWAIDAAAPRFGADGRFLGYIGSVIDITDRKRAESLARCQKQALEMVVQGLPLPDVLDYLCRTIENESQEGVIACIHLLDDAATEFQHTAAPSLPESYARAVEGMPVSSATGPCCQAVSTRQTVGVPDVAADPQWAAFCGFALPLGLRACWSTPIFSADQKVLGTFANYYRAPRDPNPRDQQLVEVVTRTVAVAIERKRAEEKLRASEYRFARFMQHLPGLAWIKDLDGRYVYANDAAERAFRTPRAEFYGKTDKEVFPPETAAQFRENDQRALTSESGIQTIETLEHADGIHHHSIVSKFPIPGSDGKTVLVGGVAIDITERMRAEEALQQSDRRKNEFLAMLAHELRNPLAPIRNALQIMRLTGGNGEAVHSASEMMERQVGQMVRLVDDLLDVSRISRGKIELRKGRVELASVVNHAVEAARSLYKSMNHELTVTLPPQPIYLNGDPTRLAQVVGNLLNNACKFTDKGGRIWLTVEQEGEQAVIRVRDTGIGIAADQLLRIFDMFTQVDTSLERSHGGLGIGLSLVKNLVEMHGGTAVVHSAGIAQGSEFVVRLPTLVETAKLPSEPTVSEPTPTTARRILVVDDNPDSAESLAILLELTGNETHAAHDGLEAVEAAATFKPDVVLLDIGLPEMNGYEAARNIREQPWGKNMVLVALTGWGQEDDRQKSRDAGFDAHMVKPVDYAALMKLLASLSPGAGSAS